MTLKLISGHNLPPPVEEVLGLAAGSVCHPTQCRLSSTATQHHPLPPPLTYLQAKRGVNPYVIVRVSGAKNDCKMVAECPSCACITGVDNDDGHSPHQDCSKVVRGNWLHPRLAPPPSPLLVAWRRMHLTRTLSQLEPGLHVFDRRAARGIAVHCCA